MPKAENALDASYLLRPAPSLTSSTQHHSSPVEELLNFSKIIAVRCESCHREETTLLESHLRSVVDVQILALDRLVRRVHDGMCLDLGIADAHSAPPSENNTVSTNNAEGQGEESYALQSSASGADDREKDGRHAPLLTAPRSSRALEVSLRPSAALLSEIMRGGDRSGTPSATVVSQAEDRRDHVGGTVVGTVGGPFALTHAAKHFVDYTLMPTFDLRVEDIGLALNKKNAGTKTVEDRRNDLGHGTSDSPSVDPAEENPSGHEMHFSLLLSSSLLSQVRSARKRLDAVRALNREMKEELEGLRRHRLQTARQSHARRQRWLRHLGVVLRQSTATEESVQNETLRARDLSARFHESLRPLRRFFLIADQTRRALDEACAEPENEFQLGGRTEHQKENADEMNFTCSHHGDQGVNEGAKKPQERRKVLDVLDDLLFSINTAQLELTEGERQYRALAGPTAAFAAARRSKIKNNSTRTPALSADLNARTPSAAAAVDLVNMGVSNRETMRNTLGTTTLSLLGEQGTAAASDPNSHFDRHRAMRGGHGLASVAREFEEREIALAKRAEADIQRRKELEEKNKYISLATATMSSDEVISGVGSKDMCAAYNADDGSTTAVDGRVTGARLRAASTRHASDAFVHSNSSESITNGNNNKNKGNAHWHISNTNTTKETEQGVKEEEEDFEGVFPTLVKRAESDSSTSEQRSSSSSSSSPPLSSSLSLSLTGLAASPTVPSNLAAEVARETIGQRTKTTTNNEESPKTVHLHGPPHQQSHQPTLPSGDCGGGRLVVRTVGSSSSMNEGQRVAAELPIAVLVPSTPLVRSSQNAGTVNTRVVSLLNDVVRASKTPRQEQVGTTISTVKEGVANETKHPSMTTTVATFAASETQKKTSASSTNGRTQPPPQAGATLVLESHRVRDRQDAATERTPSSSPNRFRLSSSQQSSILRDFLSSNSTNIKSDRPALSMSTARSNVITEIRRENQKDFLASAEKGHDVAATIHKEESQEEQTHVQQQKEGHQFELINSTRATPTSFSQEAPLFSPPTRDKSRAAGWEDPPFPRSSTTTTKSQRDVFADNTAHPAATVSTSQSFSEKVGWLRRQRASSSGGSAASTYTWGRNQEDFIKSRHIDSGSHTKAETTEKESAEHKETKIYSKQQGQGRDDSNKRRLFTTSSNIPAKSSAATEGSLQRLSPSRATTMKGRLADLLFDDETEENGRREEQNAPTRNISHMSSVDQTKKTTSLGADLVDETIQREAIPRERLGIEKKERAANEQERDKYVGRPQSPSSSSLSPSSPSPSPPRPPSPSHTFFLQSSPTLILKAEHDSLTRASLMPWEQNSWHRVEHSASAFNGQEKESGNRLGHIRMGSTPMQWTSSPFAPSSSFAGQHESGENPLHRRRPGSSPSYSSAPRPSSEIAPRPTTMSAVLEAIRTARERRHSPGGVQTADKGMALRTTPLRTRQSVLTKEEEMPPQRSVAVSLQSLRMNAAVSANTNTSQFTSVKNTSPRGWGYSDSMRNTPSSTATPFGFDTVSSASWRSPDKRAAALRQHYGFGQ